MITPNNMPQRAQVRANPDYAGECMDPQCCTHFYAPQIVGRKRPTKRTPRAIRNTQLADQLKGIKL